MLTYYAIVFYLPVHYYLQSESPRALYEVEPNSYIQGSDFTLNPVDAQRHQRHVLIVTLAINVKPKTKINRDRL